VTAVIAFSRKAAAGELMQHRRSDVSAADRRFSRPPGPSASAPGVSGARQSPPARRFDRLAWGLWLAAGFVHAQSLPPGRYEVTTRMSMPHLEENLRETATTERRCLSGQALPTLFPALEEPGLRHCRLELANMKSAAPALELDYVLRCTEDPVTSGEAQWRLAGAGGSGRLAVRLGGKNMTFAQLVAVRRLGGCD
jgi:hypothetical protein